MKKYFKGWNEESIKKFLEARIDNRRTCIDDNGYVHYFSDGSTFECRFSSWKDKTPTEYYINGELVYSCNEY